MFGVDVGCWCASGDKHRMIQNFSFATQSRNFIDFALIQIRVPLHALENANQSPGRGLLRRNGFVDRFHLPSDALPLC